jgi:hypothetical protein
MFSWKDVARAVNAAANGDQALYRKPLGMSFTPPRRSSGGLAKGAGYP